MPPSKTPPGKIIGLGLAAALLLVVFLFVLKELNPREEARPVPGYRPWSEKVVETAAVIPVQDGGRVKPLSTQAGFLMLRMHGARSMEVQAEQGTVAIDPTAWMLDALFRPELAVKLPTFRIDNSDVLNAVGLEIRGRRDRYSYEEIEPGRDRLLELAQNYENQEKQDADSLEPVQKQTLDLARNLRLYESLLGYLNFARQGIVMRPLPGSDATPRETAVSTLVATAPVIHRVLTEAQRGGQAPPPHLTDLLEQITHLSNLAKFGLFVLPPPADSEEKIWLTAGNRIWDVMTGADRDPETAVRDLQAMERLVEAEAEGPDAFAAALEEFRQRVVERAEALGQYRAIESERAYYERNYFVNAMTLCILGFILILLGWAAPASRVGRFLAWGTWACTLAAFALIVAGIVHRSYIMNRAPVGNLYDTIPFIAAGAMLVLMLLELVTKRRFALGVAAVIGMLGLLLARRFEVGDATDTMAPLVAVLDSNFWLTTHVITITLGYAAGLATAFLGHVYIFMRVLKVDDRELRRSLTRAVYGCVCLTLLLSLVGTVLGGIWANYSWGRFWGWDPKENGALMIVLWNLAILHARLGGYIREWGLHLAAIMGAIVVAFSWWHVNFLGVGLHNYGFTEGRGTLNVFYGLEGLILLLGGAAWAWHRFSPPAKPKAAAKPAEV